MAGLIFFWNQPSDPLARVTQTYAEVADSARTRARASQVYAEVADSSRVTARVTQAYAELADSSDFPGPPDPTPTIPDADPEGPAGADSDVWAIFD